MRRAPATVRDRTIQKKGRPYAMRVECVVTSLGRSCVREPSLLTYLLSYLVGRAIEGVARHACAEHAGLRHAGDDPMLSFT